MTARQNNEISNLAASKRCSSRHEIKGPKDAFKNNEFINRHFVEEIISACDMTQQSFNIVTNEE